MGIGVVTPQARQQHAVGREMSRHRRDDDLGDSAAHGRHRRHEAGPLRHTRTCTKSRGSSPLAVVTARTAFAICALAMRRMPRRGGIDGEIERLCELRRDRSLGALRDPVSSGRRESSADRAGRRRHCRPLPSAPRLPAHNRPGRARRRSFPARHGAPPSGSSRATLPPPVPTSLMSSTEMRTGRPVS